MADQNTSWDPDFGKGVFAFSENGDMAGVTAERVVGIAPSGSGMYYEDYAGRLATLEGLKPEELSVLAQKHFS